MAPRKNNLVSPFIKWVGGKRQLLADIEALLPKDIAKRVYCEPFIGGGAVLFSLQPKKKAIINDFNNELIDTYLVIKEEVEELIQDLKKHVNEADYFYDMRALDRSSDYALLTRVERASRLIYLNKTCYNGLYRVNSSGEFNTPFGKYKSPNIVNEPVLRAVSNYLNKSNVEINCGDYETVLRGLPKNSFVYLDPPYHPLSTTSSFTGYIQGGWREEDQLRLRDNCRELNKRGIKFMLSNSASDFIREIYDGFKIHTVQATRALNSVAAKRGPIDEYIITNY